MSIRTHEQHQPRPPSSPITTIAITNHDHHRHHPPPSPSSTTITIDTTTRDYHLHHHHGYCDSLSLTSSPTHIESVAGDDVGWGADAEATRSGDGMRDGDGCSDDARLRAGDVVGVRACAAGVVFVGVMDSAWGECR